MHEFFALDALCTLCVDSQSAEEYIALDIEFRKAQSLSHLLYLYSNVNH